MKTFLEKMTKCCKRICDQNGLFRVDEAINIDKNNQK